MKVKAKHITTVAKRTALSQLLCFIHLIFAKSSCFPGQFILYYMMSLRIRRYMPQKSWFEYICEDSWIHEARLSVSFYNLSRFSCKTFSLGNGSWVNLLEKFLDHSLRREIVGICSVELNCVLEDRCHSDIWEAKFDQEPIL